MRVVIDTNVVLSGMFWQGRPSRVLEAAQSGKFDAITSVGLLDELQKHLSATKFQPMIRRIGRTKDQLFADYVKGCLVVQLAALSSPICRDPGDDVVIATALAGGADIVVSGDQDLLTIIKYQSVEFLSAADLLTRLGLP